MTRKQTILTREFVRPDGVAIPAGKPLKVMGNLAQGCVTIHFWDKDVIAENVPVGILRHEDRYSTLPAN